jgi:signal transduction histidine kinase
MGAAIRMADSFIAALKEARALVAGAPTAQPGEAIVARRLTRELGQAIARLEGKDNERDLISVVCHDLKDPLASIVMGAGFLRKTARGDDPASKRVIEAIARSADRMGHVITDFHDLAKLESARLDMEVQPNDVVAVVRAAVAPFEAPDEQRPRLEVVLPDPPLVALCDKTRLMQAVSKLVGNAVKFTQPQGRIAVRAERAEGRVRITVSDTGRGIPADRLETIFDHAANARRTPRDGPGLGLAIARGVVEAQGGELRVQSELGKGSTFVIVLRS